MCGRFALTASAPRLARLLGLLEPPQVVPRFNIAPTQAIGVVRHETGGARRWAMLRWGLVPAWSRSMKGGPLLINARAETLAAKPAFRHAFRHRRCLIPATGFFEWQTRQDHKQPFFFSLANGEPFAFAGIWERWRGPDEALLESCAIITTNANALVATVHQRMPVLVPLQAYESWLSTEEGRTDALMGLLAPYPAAQMRGHPVSSEVNNVANDNARCVQALGDPL